MKHLLISLLAVMLTQGALQAQSLSRQVIGSLGSYTETADLSLSATAGQPAASTTITGSFTLLEGFQQPEGLVPTGIESPEAVVVTYQLYPNPTEDVLHLRLSSPEWLSLQIRLQDMTGREISALTQTLRGQGALETNLSLAGLPAGSYVLSISDAQGQWVKSHQIRKH